jgi:hypothetical protein
MHTAMAAVTHRTAATIANVTGSSAGTPSPSDAEGRRQNDDDAEAWLAKERTDGLPNRAHARP